MKILVSACLMGDNCKYDGGNNLNEKVMKFVEGHDVIKVCPECLGGLPTPRISAEIVNGVVTNADGICVDIGFKLGAEKALKIALDNKVDIAILQSRSPSCGPNEVYDGTFSRKLIPGMGIFAKLLCDNGIKIIDVKDL